MSTRMFPERHPLIAYFVLTFGISWGGVLLVVWPGGFPPTQATFERLLPLAVAAMLAGPTVGGILATWLRSGTPGVRELWTRIRRPGAAARWWVIALLTAPILMSGVLFALSALAPEYLPGILATGDPGGLLRFGLVLGLAAGVFEELGWTGVALPLLRRRFGVAASGLILGLVWAAWHLLPAWWFSTRTTVPGSTAAVLLDPFLFLVGYRVLMVWVWEQTRSLPVAMGMHASLTASARILGPLQMAGTMLLAHDVVWAVVVGLIVATVIDAGDRVATRRRAI